MNQYKKKIPNKQKSSTRQFESEFTKNLKASYHLSFSNDSKKNWRGRNASKLILYKTKISLNPKRMTTGISLHKKEMIKEGILELSGRKKKQWKEQIYG